VETWDAIRSRRNVRAHAEEAIATEHLDQILEAARRTPSAGNQQPWPPPIWASAAPIRRLPIRISPGASWASLRTGSAPG
jgi:Nitroreductase family